MTDETMMQCSSCGEECHLASSGMCMVCEDAPDFTPCPKCGADVAEWDGFGVLFHAPCGYCKHAARTGDVCDFCGKAVP